ncbi:ABC transporter substrate-binding protein [Spirochaeta cellobiosiphila]|uniref:ABC transporter substrate-binding protein n=1 Tax=Spirochaeta cellobiosiphila TaxID=504483 RepID=UPI00040C4CAA|nr:ABC transporter substrate-binding protein [Spirochaeta cellobiosiphila]
MKIKLSFYLIICSLIITSCNNKQELTKVTTVLDWTVNTNQTGLYVAKEKGYFKEEGLDVDIQFPPEMGADAVIASGQADYGVSYQENITFARASQIPIVAIAAVIQHNTSGFAARSTTGISRPKHFEGKRYGGWGSPVEEATLKALMDKDNGDYSKVENISLGTMDFFSATEKSIDFSWIFEGWDGIASQVKGIDINYIPLVQYDKALDYYTPVLATSENKIKNNPDQVKAFLKAVSKGYEFSIKNPQEAANILLKYAPELDRELVIESQKYLADKYQAEASQWGHMKLSVWTNYKNWLLDRNLLSKDIDESQAFTNEYLPR